MYSIEHVSVGEKLYSLLRRDIIIINDFVNKQELFLLYRMKIQANIFSKKYPYMHEFFYINIFNIQYTSI